MDPATASLAFSAAESFGTADAVANAAALSLPSFSTAATIGSSLISGLGSINQSRASAASAGYNAKIAAQNAQLQEQNAAIAGSVGQQNVGAEGAKTKAAIGTELANQGASGVDVNTGSAVDVRESEAKLGMLNALTIRGNAAKQAYGFQTQALSDREQAVLDRQQQKYDKQGGYLSAAANVLGGVGQASMYNRWLNGSSSPVGNLTSVPADFGMYEAPNSNSSN